MHTTLPVFFFFPLITDSSEGRRRVGASPNIQHEWPHQSLALAPLSASSSDVVARSFPPPSLVIPAAENAELLHLEEEGEGE
ncbi:hypothetical protein AAC387_Pa11g1003 [Persea americana]